MAKIWWDAGHGGRDPGAVYGGLQEEDLNLKIVKYGMNYLEDHYTGFEQRATRLTDKEVVLSKRDDLADAWDADVFCSVHINAGKGTGFESYIYSGGVGSSTVAYQNVVHNEVLAAMRKFGNITDRGKKRANFSVLRETEMPALLTENLFIDSNDAKYLKNEEFLKAVGEGHARGIAKFLGLKKKPTPKPTPKPIPNKKGLYKVQVGAFKEVENARALSKRLEKDGYKNFIKFEEE